MPPANRGGMGRLGDKAAETTNAQLAEAEVQLLKETAANLEALRPKITDKAAFDALVKAVRESTARNENIAQLKQRLTELGQGAVAVAREAAKLMRPI